MWALFSRAMCLHQIAKVSIFAAELGRNAQVHEVHIFFTFPCFFHGFVQKTLICSTSNAASILKESMTPHSRPDKMVSTQCELPTLQEFDCRSRYRESRYYQCLVFTVVSGVG